MNMTRVTTGLEHLTTDRSNLIAGRRVGLLVNHTAVLPDLSHALDAVRALPDVTLSAVFGPEHGVLGVAQDMEAVGGESAAVLPFHSLYGDDEESLKPRPEWLAGLDAVIYDIQDVGSRYYTYLATLSYMMEAAREVDLEVIVCDRPNPIDAVTVEGGIVRSLFRSFVGRFPISTRHGLTAGEMARLLAEEPGLDCRLTVVPMTGYDRTMWYDQTGLPWVLPSPNMPTLDTATVYPGACLFEGTNLSEGRGTTRPFELVGAPWIDGPALALELNGLELPGVGFRATAFTPKHQKWRDQLCHGVQIHVTDRTRFKALLTSVAVIRAVAQAHPRSFDWRREPYEFVTDRLAIDLLAGNDVLRGQIERGDPLDLIEASWEEERQGFLAQREKALLY